jgi:hypothetical protein
MRRAAPLLLLLLAGCSTAPIADLLDFFSPGRFRAGQGTPYGGVCIPQGGPIAAPTAPATVPAGAPAPGVPIPAVPAPSSPFLPAQPTSLIPPPDQGGKEVPVTRTF